MGEIMSGLELSDECYTLVDENMWVTVKGFSVRIHATDEGVVVDIYKNGHEDEDAIAATYAFDNDLADEDEVKS